MTGIDEHNQTTDQEATARILLAHLVAAMITTGRAEHEIEPAISLVQLSALRARPLRYSLRVVQSAWVMMSLS